MARDSLRNVAKAGMVARMGQSEELAASSLRRMSLSYVEVTLEAPQLADGVAQAATACISEKLGAAQEFVAANVM